MKRYRLLKSQIDNASRLSKKAASANGREICGLLVYNDFFVELVHATNKTKRGGGFSFYFHEIRLLQRMAGKFKHEIIGTFHSHPAGLAEPGRSDIENAQDDSFMLIFDVLGKDARLWRIKNRRARSVNFEVI